MTRRSGGWPLTMFLTPDGAPFFGGTYFPKEGRYGLPGFLDLLPRVAAAYREQGADIAEQAARAQERAREPRAGPRRTRAARRSRPPPRALAELEQRFDPEYGGFGAAPKFPHATDLELCLRRARCERTTPTRSTVVGVTLARMADGGIHDQLGGGFCRYSVDARVDDSALREDALRQRAAARPVRGSSRG